jgi:uncharacterized protein YcbK (DUF882 family)
MLSAFAAAGLVAPPATAAKRRTRQERSLAFYNTHTGEQLKTVYWANGKYLKGELAAIDRVLRDHYSDEVSPIDGGLLDLLYTLQHKLGARQAFHVVSAYRSPATNAMLRRHGSGVARFSLHTQGKAIDVRLPDRDLAALRRAALSLQRGGVGYYPQSDFVHLDTGKVRFW